MFKVAFSFFSNSNQSACSTFDSVLNNQEERAHSEFWEILNQLNVFGCSAMVK